MREVDPTSTGRGPGRAGGIVLMTEPRILTQEWREEHVRQGDKALFEVAKALIDFDNEDSWNKATDEEVIASTGMIQLLVGLAQAHYQAANVRARPDVTP
jgi:hypothetical protein